MTLKTSILFDKPQREIASLIRTRLGGSTFTSIITGFMTPGGVEAIAKPIKENPHSVANIIVGAATFPAFKSLEGLLEAGVPPDHLRVHLGHTRLTGNNANTFARYHPMLHSKIYYMENANGDACAFIGSNNVTSFSLLGLNSEAAILFEGPANEIEFSQVRKHIDIIRSQAVIYSPLMRKAYTWWTREYINGLLRETKMPPDMMTSRTLVILASADEDVNPKVGDHIYFEIPAGIKQIESLKTEMHLFLFRNFPSDPKEALRLAPKADAKFTCKINGVDNAGGNLEVKAEWCIDSIKLPLLKPVSDGVFRTNTITDMQQIRAKVERSDIMPFHYEFEREIKGWEPEFSVDHTLETLHDDILSIELDTKRLKCDCDNSWRLVNNLVPKNKPSKEKDQKALDLVTPRSGSFILVSLRKS